MRVASATEAIDSNARYFGPAAAPCGNARDGELHIGDTV
jgi:hypothetical protein